LRYSIVIPAYNESRRIGPTLDRVLEYIRQQAWDAEVVVVNDGSKDDTAEIVRGYERRNERLRLIENPGNRGKGYSDADLSAPIEEAEKLFRAIGEGADVAIGSRWLRADLQTERQPIMRQLFGRVFNLILRVVLGLKFKDTQCGFKGFTRAAAEAIFPRQRIERWGFDPELIFLAQKLGYRVVETAVAWAHAGDSTISPLKDGTRMFAEVLKIRWNDLSGKYAADLPVSDAKS
jgi:glycosyltransferase involved in cell wall biosynthesis